LEVMDALLSCCPPTIDTARANDPQPAVRGMFVADLRAVLTNGDDELMPPKRRCADYKDS
jgi:hypothetical protein